VYNDRMERAFVVDAVVDAVAQIEKHGKAAYPLFHDPTGPYIAKDAYVFVVTPEGIDLVNPAFPNLEGRNLLDLRDTQGKPLIREMLDVVQTKGSGWVDYMWPKPGDSVSTQKATYVSKAKIGTTWVMVGCGVYLADAPKATIVAPTITAPALMTLVREGAAVFEQRGESAYPEFREKGSKWFRDDTYFFVWTMDGIRSFHAADPSGEGQNVSDLKDILGRPIGKMILEAAASPSGEGWIHYMYPEPGDIFPTWKSTFVKRVTFPSGTQFAIGSGIYNMQTDRTFIEDVVNRAATLVAARGKDAFNELRDKTGPFVFKDTYVFLDRSDGVELVNAAQPSLEGTNLMGLRDLKGKALADEYIAAAMKDGSAWVEYFWYKPGHNTPARKQAYVQKVQSGADTYIVGSGFYVDEPDINDELGERPEVARGPPSRAGWGPPGAALSPSPPCLIAQCATDVSVLGYHHRRSAESERSDR
jgi:signal transduction histidine kinase